MDKQNTLHVERPHVVLTGKVNTGKSTLFNKLIGQDLAVTSSLRGTTTDAVRKAMELPGVGPIVLIDTPGLEDNTALGIRRMSGTIKILREADLIIVLLEYPDRLPDEIINRANSVPIIPVIAKPHEGNKSRSSEWLDSLEQQTGIEPLQVDAESGRGITLLIDQIKKHLSEKTGTYPHSITGRLAKKGDLVLLVMPQDSSAPTGRLILPQVQTIRELLDKGCRVLCTQPEDFLSSLGQLTSDPDLIITDSQVFETIDRLRPNSVPLTSFSVLMSGYKGDLQRLVAGAKAIDRLTEKSKILIAEACTHAPETEDIGTVKIPIMLRKRFGNELVIDHVSGKDFPSDLTGYDLVIHCGACMFNRQHLLNRQNEAELQDIPMTNYGLAIAHLLGILTRIALP